MIFLSTSNNLHIGGGGVKFGPKNPPIYESAITITSKAPINKFNSHIRTLVLGVRLDENRSKSVRPVRDVILVLSETMDFQGILYIKTC